MHYAHSPEGHSPHPHTPEPMRAKPATQLSGTVRVPGDKSISQRALMLGAMAIGVTQVEGILDSADIRSTAGALRALGIRIDQSPPDQDGATSNWHIYGVGTGGLDEPASVLDLGNSGTGARLLTGLLATHGFTSFMTGDASLVNRPMRRVLAPLGQFGAQFIARSADRLPMAIIGATQPMPVSYSMPVPSAQVKSAILLAAINAPGRSTLIETVHTRDHTERMLTYLGAQVDISDGQSSREITIKGYPELTAKPITVPGDPSSAAFPIVAALLIPGSAITLPNIGMGAGRTGLIETLRDMGAQIEITPMAAPGDEPVATIAVGHSALKAVDVPASRAAAMIDEYPILAVAAACAEGETRFNSIGELRVKECDRLEAIVAMLRAAGVTVENGEDWMTITGKGGRPSGPKAETIIETHYDHRIAMAALVLGMVSESPVTIDDGHAIGTSFPGFAALMSGLGATIENA